jgi:peptidylprolyl isomerase
MRYLRLVFGFIFGLMSVSTADTALAAPDSDILYMELKSGRVVITMRPDLAPKHVARIKELVRQKFYDGLVFHRVIEGFMAQTGDPKGNGTGGSGKNIRAEFTNEPHRRGTLSMAHSSNPNSADSQFFIVLADAPHLNGQYTVWGQVQSGMEHIDQIKLGVESMNGKVFDPDTIISMQMADDAAQ